MDLEPIAQTSSSTDDTTVVYECVPPEIVRYIDDYLPFEDSCNFQESSSYVNTILSDQWPHYNKVQIGDDPDDCRLMCTNHRSKPRWFSEVNLEAIFAKCTQISEIVIIIKEMRSLHTTIENPQLLKDTSLYHKNGYLGHFLARIQPSQVPKLHLVSLHVDIMRESLRELWFPCPVEDLYYSIRNLSNAPFETFIQISFCSTNFYADDYYLRNLLMSGMEIALKQIAKEGAKTEFTIDPAEGYVDMIAEKGKVEYSFAFFYYNPEICELPPLSSSTLCIKQLPPLRILH